MEEENKMDRNRRKNNGKEILRGFEKRASTRGKREP
jgi:hypothetical protein